MTTMKKAVTSLGFMCAYALAWLGTAHAGTVINTNLPPGTTIVNIDARADGAAAWSGPNPPQPFWHQPIGGVELTLQPGTYQFRVVSAGDAAVLFPNLTSAQLTQIYTAWTYNSPWLTNYMVFNITARLNPNESQIFDGGDVPGGTPIYGSAQSAYDGIVASGYHDNIRPAPPGRAGQAPSDFLAQWTFNVPTTLVFAVPDNILSDNTGGVSVIVTTVPEPSTAALVIGGAVLTCLSVRRRRLRKAA
jgi:hypothetical protein